MGIQGLSTFVDKYFVRWERKRLRGRLVIDGNNLMHTLHNTDWSNGGQYPEYREKVRVFFKALKMEGIEPIVIFDGVDYEEQKTAVMMRRRREWIKHIQDRIGSHSTRPLQCCGRIIPGLCSSVFKMALTDLGVSFFVADGEGDETIARVANHYSCPVVSNDSDFYIFRLKGGYIPYDRFFWESTPITGEVYYLEAFAKQFKFQDVALCYAIPAIVGNDFLPPCSHRYMNSIVPDGENLSIRFKAICQYLSEFRSLEFYIRSRLGGPTQESRCLQSQAQYSIPKSQSCEDLAKSTVLKHHDGSDFPQWLIHHFRCGRVPSFVMEAAVLSKILFRVVPDNFQKSSSVTLSRTIRQSLYTLLKCECVTEYIRHGMDIAGDRIPCVCLRDGYELPALSSVDSLSPRRRQRIFFNILQCDECIMDRFRGRYHDWQLIAAATMFWAKHTSISIHIVKALLLCFLICSGLKRRLTEIRWKCLIRIDFRRSQKWLDTLHAFAQWQSTYHDAVALNAVLMEPLRVSSVATLYDGHIAMSLAGLGDIDLASTTYDIDATLYKKLKEAALSSLVPPGPGPSHKMGGATAPQSHKAGGSTAVKKTTPVKKPPLQDSMFAYANRFALLQIDSDSEAEDVPQ